MEIRKLGPADEDRLEIFLSQHADSSMFLRANVRAAGLVDRGGVREGTYYAAFDGEAITAVAAHAWNGSLLIQAPRHATDVARAAATATGRPVVVLSGPFEHVLAVREGLGLADAEAARDSREKLYALSLEDMRVPARVANGEWRCRHAREDEVALLTTWRVQYAHETLGLPLTAELEAESRRTVERQMNERACWVVTGADDAPRAVSGFNAMLPDVVQIGGVWTPVADRGQGLARAAVAGSLLAARDTGVRRAILFTAVPNVAAQRAYEALGFTEIGSYGIVLFQSPRPL